jgi:hypothetical protein
LRTGEIGVPEHLLDVADIRPVLQHQRGHGVAEDVAGSGLAQIGGLDIAPDQLGEWIGLERLAAGAQKQVISSAP